MTNTASSFGRRKTGRRKKSFVLKRNKRTRKYSILSVEYSPTGKKVYSSTKKKVPKGVRTYSTKRAAVNMKNKLNGKSSTGRRTSGRRKYNPNSRGYKWVAAPVIGSDVEDFKWTAYKCENITWDDEKHRIAHIKDKESGVTYALEIPEDAKCRNTESEALADAHKYATLAKAGIDGIGNVIPSYDILGDYKQAYSGGTNLLANRIDEDGNVITGGGSSLSNFLGGGGTGGNFSSLGAGATGGATVGRMKKFLGPGRRFYKADAFKPSAKTTQGINPRVTAKSALYDPGLENYAGGENDRLRYLRKALGNDLPKHGVPDDVITAGMNSDGIPYVKSRKRLTRSQMLDPAFMGDGYIDPKVNLAEMLSAKVDAQMRRSDPDDKNFYDPDSKMKVEGDKTNPPSSFGSRNRKRNMSDVAGCGFGSKYGLKYANFGPRFKLEHTLSGFGRKRRTSNFGQINYGFSKYM